MFKHHKETIARGVAKLKADPTVLAVICGGSIAHGYALPDSDVDFLVVVTEPEFRRRKKAGKLMAYDGEFAQRPCGYVDYKFTSLSFLRKTARIGSQPARYAYRDAKVVYSRVRGLPALLRRIARFPEKDRKDMIRRFLSQISAWRWYFYETRRRADPYLSAVATSKLVLFGCRIVLARHGVLYPYHKWLFRELEQIPGRPRGIIPLAKRILTKFRPADVEQFYRVVRKASGVPESDRGWPAKFIMDSELNWMDGKTPIDDL